MKPYLIEAAKIKLHLSFICDLIQGGRKKPKKFKHSLKLPEDLYKELKDLNIIDPEFYYLDESAFFEFSTDGFVTISFICLYQCEDLHRKIDHYLVLKYSGSYPIQRFGIFF